MNIGMNAALSGLLSAQRALDVASHNISNANTPGYSRQRADLVANPPFGAGGIGLSYGHSTGAGMVGTGVTVQSIKRVRDQFIDRQLYAETSPLGEAKVGLDTLNQVQSIFGEPSDQALNTLMGKFWNAWQDLSTHADNSAYRIALRDAGNSLSFGFQELHGQLNSLRNEANERIQVSVKDLNNLVKQVAHLNQEIKAAFATGQNPNDLQDQQDALIEQISGFAKINVYEVPATGAKNIYLAGDPLVLEEHDFPLQLTSGAGGFYDITVPDNLGGAPRTATIASGSLRGLLDARDITLSDTDPRGFLTQLNKLASAIVTQVNTLHSGGVGLNGAPSTTFFDPSVVPMDASNMAINPVFFNVPNGLDSIAAGATGAGSGDGANATAIAQLRVAKIAGLGNVTAEDFYKNALTQAGTMSQELERRTKTQDALIGSLKDRIEQVSGVSTDEEMGNIIRYQKAYAASAKVLSTIDQMLETLLAIR